MAIPMGHPPPLYGSRLSPDGDFVGPLFLWLFLWVTRPRSMVPVYPPMGTSWGPYSYGYSYASPAPALWFPSIPRWGPRGAPIPMAIRMGHPPPLYGSRLSPDGALVGPLFLWLFLWVPLRIREFETLLSTHDCLQIAT